jgi:hypothetical protein
MAGAFTEFGGLGRTAGVSFVQSHDSYPPGAQPNAAYAFVLTRVGHSVVFYDGHNPDSNSFVLPGREDALGELGSDRLLRLIDIRNRFARGGMFNRWVGGDAYVYERVVPTSNGVGGATLLVALSDRTSGEVKFGEFDEFSLVVTEFAPGTVLQELTGNGAYPEVTVLDPASVAESARDLALSEYDRSSDFPLPNEYGLVYLQIPAGPDNGYVAYAPRMPAMGWSLTDANGQPLPLRRIQTVGLRTSASGATVPAQEIGAYVIRDPSVVRMQVGGSEDPTASAIYVQIDNEDVDIGGLSRVSSTTDGVYDGWHEFPFSAPSGPHDAVFDLSSLSHGIHTLSIRVASATYPHLYAEAHTEILIERPGPTQDAGPGDVDPAPDTGVGVPDAGVEDVGVGVDAGTNPNPVPSKLDRIVEAILDEAFDGELDIEPNGVIDVRDYVLEREANR